MKSTPTPWTHVGVTCEQLSITFTGGGRIPHNVTVPVGTLCHKLDGGSRPWVVGNLGFLEDKQSMLYHDADHYGIRIPEDRVVGIQDANDHRGIAQVVRERLIAKHGQLPPNPHTPDFDTFAERVKTRLICDGVKNLSDDELNRSLGYTVAATACLAVALRLIADGLTIKKLYENCEAGVDDVFNALVQMGQDVSVDDARALREKLSPEDHFAILTAATHADLHAVIKAAQERGAFVEQNTVVEETTVWTHYRLFCRSGEHFDCVTTSEKKAVEKALEANPDLLYSDITEIFDEGIACAPSSEKKDVRAPKQEGNDMLPTQRLADIADMEP